ncbi:hypothetical protein GCM10010421_11850 [Streptomyces glaucus]|uniref:Secreted protein n=1 Tax=Streptomyces glaucus TaxID=284029 RepID=A0ABP5WHW5_9ACTN
MKWPRSNATISSSPGPFIRRACDAADIPAASPPITTSRSAAPRARLMSMRTRYGVGVVRSRPFPRAGPLPAEPSVAVQPVSAGAAAAGSGTRGGAGRAEGRTPTRASPGPW